jgi:hypothetical protein
VEFGEFESAILNEPGSELESPSTKDLSTDSSDLGSMSGNGPDKPPRVGGKGIDNVYWTGGSRIIARSILTEPASTLAYRSTDLKSASILEAKITSGLSEKAQLNLADAAKETKTITLTSWIAAVRAEVVDCGMDSVFRIEASDTSENFILDNWGSVKGEDVTVWVNKLLNDGCKFDKYNLTRSGKFLINSITHELWDRIRTSVPDNQPSGPQVFTAIVLSHQVSSATVVRTLVMELSNLRLNKIPGENVELLSQLVIEKAQCICGTGQEPRDFNMLVATCFLQSKSSQFEAIANKIHSKADDLLIKDWKTEIVHPLLKKYTSLKAQGLWPSANVSISEIQGLNAKIAALEARLDCKVSESNGNRDSSGKREPTCWKCGEKGHVKPNCPKNDESGSGRTSSNNNNNGRSPPKDGEDHTRTRNNVVEKWCRRCRRWTKGDKAHLTDEHVSKKDQDKAITKASVAQTEDDRSYEDESYLMRTRLYKAVLAKDVPDALFWCEICDGFKPEVHDCIVYHPKDCAGQFNA